MVGAGARGAARHTRRRDLHWPTSTHIAACMPFRQASPMRTIRDSWRDRYGHDAVRTNGYAHRRGSAADLGKLVLAQVHHSGRICGQRFELCVAEPGSICRILSCLNDLLMCHGSPCDLRVRNAAPLSLGCGRHLRVPDTPSIQFRPADPCAGAPSRLSSPTGQVTAQINLLRGNNGSGICLKGTFPARV